MLFVIILLGQNITIPTDVKNAIEDVFKENDEVSGVECYHKEDLEQFQDDLVLTNRVELFLDGSHNGTTNNIWTYYGNMAYALNESIKLYDNENDLNEIETISESESDETTTMETPNEWAVVLHEVVKWVSGDKNVNRELKLYIYCPIPSEEEEADEYSEIYNEIRNERF